MPVDKLDGWLVVEQWLSAHRNSTAPPKLLQVKLWSKVELQPALIVLAEMMGKVIVKHGGPKQWEEGANVAHGP